MGSTELPQSVQRDVTVPLSVGYQHTALRPPVRLFKVPAENQTVAQFYCPSAAFLHKEGSELETKYGTKKNVLSDYHQANKKSA